MEVARHETVVAAQMYTQTSFGARLHCVWEFVCERATWTSKDEQK